MSLARKVGVSEVGQVRTLERSFRRGLCGLLAAILLPLILHVGDASAGMYTMRSCNVPGHRAAAATSWLWIHAPGTYANDECASGGGFGVNAGPMQRVTAAGVSLEPPTKAIKIRRVRLWMVARLGGSGSSLFVAAASDANGVTRAQDLFGPPGGDTLTTPFESPLLPPDTGAYVVFISCSGNTWDGCVPSSINPLEIRGAEVTLQEDSPPSGLFQGGALLDGTAQNGIRNVSYTAGDQESGVASVAAIVGETEVASQSFSTECEFSGFAACPQSKAGSLAIDTRALPNGIYPVSLRITDAANNTTTIYAPRAVHVSNSNATPPNGLRATTHAKLTARVSGRRGTTVMVPYNRRTTIRGRLSTSDGEPISNAKLEIREIPLSKRSKTITRHAMTRSNGNYVYLSTRRGATRRLEVRYRPSLDEPAVAAVARLRLNVAAAATLRINLRGVRVTYSGRLLSRPVPPGGKSVYIEGRAVGGAWTAFAHRRTDRMGRFSGRYRLRVHRPGVRLQFRVRIPKQRGYPYAANVGRSITRIVR